MKRVLAMAAVAAVFGAFAEGGTGGAIASANIVGYLDGGMGNNLNSMIQTFVPCGGGDIDIQDMIPVVTEEGKTLKSNDFVIQQYGPLGALEHSYYYILAPDTDEEEVTGWWNESSGINYSTKTFAEGEGFMVNAKKNGKFVYAGEVDGAEFGLSINVNLSHQGNLRPCEVDIQSILPEVAEGVTLKSNDFVIQQYGPLGALEHSYYYILAPDTDEEEVTGWWNESSGINYSTKKFAPGEGFHVNSKKQGQLVFPTLSL